MEKKKQIMVEGPEFWKDLEAFFTDIHSVVSVEEDIECQTFAHLRRGIWLFEEEFCRFFATLPLYYSEEEMKEAVPNLEFFENWLK